MTTNKGKQAFLAALTFLAFVFPLILANEVSLFTNWLFIFISWLVIILLSVLNPGKNKDKAITANDGKLKE